MPGKIPADAADQVKDLKVTVFTGADDQILRRPVVEGSAATGGATALLDLTLTKVGEEQTIEAPKVREALHRAAFAVPGRLEVGWRREASLPAPWRVCRAEVDYPPRSCRAAGSPLPYQRSCRSPKPGTTRASHK